MPALGAVRPAAPGGSRASARVALSGRSYRISLTGRRGQYWLTIGVGSGLLTARHQGTGTVAALASLSATVSSVDPRCSADAVFFDAIGTRLGAGTTVGLGRVVVPALAGRIGAYYLELSNAAGAGCDTSRYWVRITDHPASAVLATPGVTISAQASPYGPPYGPTYTEGTGGSGGPGSPGTNPVRVSPALAANPYLCYGLGRDQDKASTAARDISRKLRTAGGAARRSLTKQLVVEKASMNYYGGQLRVHGCL
jgi:hypothetical protein